MRIILFILAALLSLVAFGLSAWIASFVLEDGIGSLGFGFMPLYVFWFFTITTASLGWFWFVSSKGKV